MSKQNWNPLTLSIVWTWKTTLRHFSKHLCFSKYKFGTTWGEVDGQNYSPYSFRSCILMVFVAPSMEIHTIIQYDYEHWWAIFRYAKYYFVFLRLFIRKSRWSRPTCASQLPCSASDYLFQLQACQQTPAFMNTSCRWRAAAALVEQIFNVSARKYGYDICMYVWQYDLLNFVVYLNINICKI